MMKTFQKIEQIRDFLVAKRKEGFSVGLVPTMGALHEGHISLIDLARKENDIVVCTIYVNPTQFNNSQDFENYPVSLEEDFSILEKHRCDVIFHPGNEEMYSDNECISFEVGRLDTIMEGLHRKGHFPGVARVVTKFFNIIRPDRAYFGQKDLQQFVLIDNLNTSLKFGIELKRLPIVREKDGLAMSSRNRRLSLEQREKAVVFYQALEKAKDLISEGKDPTFVKDEITKRFDALPGVSMEYFEVVEATSLAPLSTLNAGTDIALCIAGFVGGIRLIDNMILQLH